MFAYDKNSSILKMKHFPWNFSAFTLDWENCTLTLFREIFQHTKVSVFFRQIIQNDRKHGNTTTWGPFQYKMPSYQYTDSPVKDKTVSPSPNTW